MAIQYRARNAEQWDKRANQKGGEFDGFIRDDYKTWSPKKGSNSVRILPPTYEDPDHYGINVFVHYNVGPNKSAVLCLQQMRNQRCPICEARTKALKLGDEEEAGGLRATKRVLVWILDRNDEQRGPMLWGMAYTLDKDFCALAKDPQTGEISPLDHPDDGYDIFFDKSGDGLQTQYGGKKLARRPSSVAEEHLDYVEERPLTDCLIWRTYEEVKTLYEGGPPPEEESSRRRATRDEDPREARTRLRAVDEPSKPAEVTRRRVTTAPTTQALREEINDEVLFDGGRAEDDDDLPRTPAPKSAAERLTERYRR